jgi:hypothetical protein
MNDGELANQVATHWTYEANWKNLSLNPRGSGPVSHQASFLRSQQFHFIVFYCLLCLVQMWTLSTSKFSLCDKYGANGVHSVEVPSSATSCYVIVYMYKRWTGLFFWARNRQNLTMILYFGEILLLKTKAANFALSFFFHVVCHQRSVYWLLF